MAVKYLVFDFDGTLADSKAIFIGLYNGLARRHGYNEITHENLAYLRGLNIPERCRYLNVPLYKVPFLAAKLIKQYRHSLPLLELSPGIGEMLGDLEAKGIQAAVVSTNSQATIEEFFRLRGIRGIDKVFCSGSVFGKDKVLKKFLKANGVKSSEVIYVGDEARDIIACRKCGIRVAWVSWGYDSLPAIEHHMPDFIISHPSELPGLASLA